MLLCNAVLGLGMCFFAGGTRFSGQGLGPSASQLGALVLTFSVFAVILPGAYHMAVSDILNTESPNATSSGSDPKEGTQILHLSHPVSDFAAVYCWAMRLMRRWQIAIILIMGKLFAFIDGAR